MECGKTHAETYLRVGAVIWKAIQSFEVKRVWFSSFQRSDAQGFVGMWESFFLAFPSIVCKVWENPAAFPGFFHAFPQYAISIKHTTLPTDSFIDPKLLIRKSPLPT